MTIVTVVAAGNMVLVLARRNIAVVTGTTASVHLAVIDPGDWSPHRVGMAVLADIGGVDVILVLTGSIGAVVAR